MGLSKEEQRAKIRANRNEKRFHDVRHLKVDVNKIKGSSKQVKKKLSQVYREVEKSLGEDYYLANNKNRKLKNKNKKKSKKNKPKPEKKLSARQIKYNEYLQSDEWIQLRIDLYNFRGYVCERCTATKFLQVHHKHYDNIYNEEPEDLEILCSSCHKKEHNIK